MTVWSATDRYNGRAAVGIVRHAVDSAELDPLPARSTIRAKPVVVKGAAPGREHEQGFRFLLALKPALGAA